ncbi:hypothetical protein KUCAC02_011153, partial [Chaenocephalus aceratus]
AARLWSRCGSLTEESPPSGVRFSPPPVFVPPSAVNGGGRDLCSLDKVRGELWKCVSIRLLFPRRSVFLLTLFLYHQPLSPLPSLPVTWVGAVGMNAARVSGLVGSLVSLNVHSLPVMAVLNVIEQQKRLSSPRSARPLSLTSCPSFCHLK